MIKYLGSKRTLLPTLTALLAEFPELHSVADVFSGTSRVGHALKGAGWRVDANDHNAYAHCLARCYVEADAEDVGKDAQTLIDEFNGLGGRPGYFTETFCERSRFFQPHNGERVDAIREAIAEKDLPPLLEAVVLTSLMEAADRVDSTCGLQMAYVKKWATRAYKPLELRLPDLQPRGAHGRSRAFCSDAAAFADEADTDVAYLDPPYNQHSYLSNYHIWESLVLWDKPEVYGIACKRVDCRERKSAFNSKPRHADAFADTVRKLRSPLLVVSFNNEGYQARAQLESVLGELGEVFVVTVDFKRYVGAQIGVHNPSGERVGKVSHLRNEEYVYVVARPPLRDRIEQATTRLEQLAARVEQVSTAASPAPAALDRVSLVADALRRKDGLALGTIRKVTGLSPYHARMALDALLGEGRIRVSQGRPQTFWIAQ